MPKEIRVGDTATVAKHVREYGLSPGHKVRIIGFDECDGVKGVGGTLGYAIAFITPGGGSRRGWLKWDEVQH